MDSLCPLGPLVSTSPPDLNLFLFLILAPAPYATVLLLNQPRAANGFCSAVIPKGWLGD